MTPPAEFCYEPGQKVRVLYNHDYSPDPNDPENRLLEAGDIIIVKDVIYLTKDEHDLPEDDWYILYESHNPDFEPIWSGEYKGYIIRARAVEKEDNEECTCPLLEVLMVSGCQCGAFARERGRK